MDITFQSGFHANHCSETDSIKVLNDIHLNIRQNTSVIGNKVQPLTLLIILFY